MATVQVIFEPFTSNDVDHNSEASGLKSSYGLHIGVVQVLALA
jgi:hypothetical protein